MSYSIEPLFQSFNLGPLTLRSHFVMLPMTRSFMPQGGPCQNVAHYYRRRAEAGAGLIITERVGLGHPAAIGGGPAALGEENTPMMSADAALAGWKNVV